MPQHGYLLQKTIKNRCRHSWRRDNGSKSAKNQTESGKFWSGIAQVASSARSFERRSNPSRRRWITSRAGWTASLRSTTSLSTKSRICTSLSDLSRLLPTYFDWPRFMEEWWKASVEVLIQREFSVGEFCVVTASAFFPLYAAGGLLARAVL